MSDVIDVLELLGADADLARTTTAGLDALLRSEGVEEALRCAILEADAGVLQALLRAPGNVCCLINPAEQEDEEEEEEPDEEGEDDGDDEEKKLVP
ncbi:MAG TPA: hypothetical protein VHE11_12405 [Steroidobacteraceae bacterium]|nr:hypothetical protein [Steroidobacteraceae bacterium]